MLRQTFCHIPGIGPVAERRLWEAGIHRWEDCLRSEAPPLSRKRLELVQRYLTESAIHLNQGNSRYFAEALPAREHWRLFPHFEHSVAYVDIETTGLGGPSDYITTIALYDGVNIRYYVHGANLEAFVDDIEAYDLLVTYNGKTFDVPFLRDYLGARMEHAHIDLRYVLAALGLKGGLKQCERALGIDREDLADVDGYFAVLLWYDFFNNGNRRALETLLAYNMLDVINLATLMVEAYNRNVAATPFADVLKLRAPTPPALPFEPHLPTIERLRRRLF